MPDKPMVSSRVMKIQRRLGEIPDLLIYDEGRNFEDIITDRDMGKVIIDEYFPNDLVFKVYVICEVDSKGVLHCGEEVAAEGDW
jgi:hypothetical protein